MTELERLLELAGMKWPTIVSASTEKDGGVNRKTSDAIIDPKGFFAKNKSKNFQGKSVNEAYPFLAYLVQTVT